MESISQIVLFSFLLLSQQPTKDVNETPRNEESGPRSEIKKYKKTKLPQSNMKPKPNFRDFKALQKNHLETKSHINQDPKEQFLCLVAKKLWRKEKKGKQKIQHKAIQTKPLVKFRGLTSFGISQKPRRT